MSMKYQIIIPGSLAFVAILSGVILASNGQAKVGVYYNYCAATVGTRCYNGSESIIEETGASARAGVESHGTAILGMLEARKGF